MKSFLELSEERDNKLKPVVMTFGRFNPPTSGHEKLVNKVKEIADQHSAPHHIILSHSQDSKKNPLSASEKVKHAKHAFPGTNIEAASKEMPTIMHHAARLNAAGHLHLIVVAGSDRVSEFHDLLHKYNGHYNDKGHGYKFKKIEVKSAGQRDPDAEGAEGMSASKMREHAKNNNYDEFHKGAPSAMKPEHRKAMFHDLRKGMGLHEDTSRGLFKAIFVTGGPGSGKDIIIKEGIPEARAVEMDLSQASNILNDKKALSEQSRDIRREAVRNRLPLIVNGTADKMEEILSIKESLEDIGYETMMVYVDTTNEISQQRNSTLKRMIAEEVRLEKWKKAQVSKALFFNVFEDFNLFKNNDDKENLEEYITDVYEHTNEFLNDKTLNDISESWMVQHGKMDISRRIHNIFEKATKKKEDVIFDRRKKNIRAIDPEKKLLRDNNSPDQQMVRKSGKIDKVTDGDVKANSGYTFRTYTEGDKPTLTVNPPPKTSNFSKDKETGKKKTAINDPNKRIKTAGVSPEYDTRPGGKLGYGLGDQTYREEVKPKKKKLLKDLDDKISGDKVGPDYSNAQTASSFYPGGSGHVTTKEGVEDKYQIKTEAGLSRSFAKFRESIDSPAESGSMGVGGTLGGATNKEPMETPKDKTGERGPNIKSVKKRKKQ